MASYKEDPNFNYVEIEDNDSVWQQFKDWLHARYIQFMRWLLGDYDGSKFLIFLVTYLPYLILIAIVGFIIWLFIRLNPGGRMLNQKEASDVLLSDEEDIIKHQDIPQLIIEAIENKQYRLAVRYNYLLILKRLKDSNIIDYQFDKTNTDYQIEIKDSVLKASFIDVTRIYDFIWYGDFKISETDYQQAARQFKLMQDKL